MYLRVPAGVRVAAVLGATTLLASCGQSQDGAVRAEDGSSAIVTPGSVDVFDVRVGDCFEDELTAGDASETAEVFDVDAVPCDERHRSEVYAIFDLPDGDYPGEDEVVRLANEGCVERFADFVGTSYEATRLDVTYLFPTRRSWEQNDDREVACAVYDPAGPLTGSVADAGADYALPAVGDCLDDEGQPADCAEDHESELYLVTELKGKKYPGDKAVEDKAVKRCVAAFADYVGADYDESELDFLYFTPDRQSWDQGDRSVACAAYDPSGPLTESVRNSGR
jgi:hypothetical protein